MFKIRALLKTSPASYRQVDHWITLGIIHPVREKPGSGSGPSHDVVFFGAEYERVRIMAELVQIGFSPFLADQATRNWPIGARISMPGVEVTASPLPPA